MRNQTRPSRPFLYIALALVFLLVIGLVVVGMLVAENRPPTGFEQTRISIASINETGTAMLWGTATLHVAETQTAAQFTPIYYTADMSPTARVTEYETVSLATRTAYAATQTHIARLTSPEPFYTPAYPYDPELYQRRRMEELGLITSGGPTEYARFYMTETALVSAYLTAQGYTATPTPTVSLTPSPTASPTFTPGGESVTRCGYAWARRDLPDVTALAESALEAAGITHTEVRVEAYGEECIDINTNTVVGFGAMTTDFYLTAQVASLTDQTALAAYVLAVYDALLTIPEDELPARFGYLDFTFTSRGQTKYMRTMFDTVEGALDRGLAGARLIQALGGIR